MRCPGKGMHEEDAECPECNGDGEVYCFDCERYRSCRECNGTGDRTVQTSGHLVPCEICDNTDEVPEFVAEWIASEQLAAIPQAAQRGIIKLHNDGLLVYPPRVVDYGETVLCVARAKSFKRMAKLLEELVAGARLMDPDSLAMPSWMMDSKAQSIGYWAIIAAPPPSYRDVLEFVRDAREEARHAA